MQKIGQLGYFFNKSRKIQDDVLVSKSIFGSHDILHINVCEDHYCNACQVTSLIQLTK